MWLHDVARRMITRVALLRVIGFYFLSAGLCIGIFLQGQTLASRPNCTSLTPRCKHIRPIDTWQWNSQQSEDVLLTGEFFWRSGVGALWNGVFVEVGALDGLTFSNTLTLESELYWSGVLIEGCPDSSKKISTNRPNPRLSIVPRAICSREHVNRSVPFSVPCGADSGVKGDHGDILTQNSRTGTTVNVPCQSMTEILLEREVTHVDLLSVDVEGYELPLLLTLDFSKVSVRLVILEVDHNRPSELRSIRKLLQAAGLHSKGLCCGANANEIWENPLFERPGGDTWVPVSWESHKQALSQIWRQRPCQPISKQHIQVNMDRDDAKMTTNFTSYVKSFDSDEFNCSRFKDVTLRLRQPEADIDDENESAEFLQATTELINGPDMSPVHCIMANENLTFYPIQFGVFDQNLRAPIKMPHSSFAESIPGNGYGFGDELSYYTDYFNSFYAITMKKAGWDCLRHYEILSAGSVPFFLNMKYLPPNTMRFWPRKIVSALMSLPGVDVSFNSSKTSCCDSILSATVDFNVFPVERYQRLREILHLYSSKYLTTSALARYMMTVSANENAKRILFITDGTDCSHPNQTGYHRTVDYLDVCILHGFKLMFGQNLHVAPHEPSFMYSDFPLQDTKHLYGNGFSYSRRLSPSLKSQDRTTEWYAERIGSNYYDFIIYGVSSNEEKPFYKVVAENYAATPARILNLNGDDSSLHYKTPFNCLRLGGVRNQSRVHPNSLMFVREL
jgi:FkbM family methyltransferase